VSFSPPFFLLPSPPIMSNIVTFFCVVHGESSERVFHVSIDKTLSISHLKKAIREEKPNDFADVDANKLMLWKVNISDEDYDDLCGDLPNGSEKLRPTWKIKDYFDEPLLERHIHIIIETPLSSSGNALLITTHFLSMTITHIKIIL
jgi:hypothetical protein